MRRVVLLAVLALALPVAFADSVTDYATFGTTSAGTATWSGIPVSAGRTISVTSDLLSHCSARWLTDIVTSKETRDNRYRTSSNYKIVSPCSGTGEMGANTSVS